MTDQEILDEKPDGAEYISNIGYLWNDNEDWFVFVNGEWVHLFFHEYEQVTFNIRSLADIEQIVEFEAECAALEHDLGMSEIELDNQAILLSDAESKLEEYL